MADIADPNGVTPPEEPEPTLGRVLSKARQARGLSIEQVALQLRIDPVFVQALENDRVDVFAAPVFVRGYLRHLADRLGLELEDLLARYAEATDAENPSVTVTRPVAGYRRRWVVRLVAALIVLLSALAVWFTWVNRDWLLNFLTFEERATTRAPKAIGEGYEPAGVITGSGFAEIAVTDFGTNEPGTMPVISVNTRPESRPARDGWRILPEFNDGFEEKRAE